MKRNEAGLTLIELMIALVIGLFMVSAVMAVFSSSNQLDRVEKNKAAMRSSAQFAFHFLNKDLRQSTYMGGPCVLGTLGSASNNLDTTSVLYDPIRDSFTPDTTLNAITGVQGANATTPDSITIKMMSGEKTGVKLAEGMATTASELSISNPVFKSNDVLLVTDCSYSDLFAVSGSLTAVNSTVTGGTVYHIPHNTAAGVSRPGNKIATLSHAYSADSYLFKIPESVSFIISNNQLVRNGNPIVDNIENMKIEYGVKLPFKGMSPSFYSSIDAIPTKYEDIVAVRVHVLTVSPEDNVNVSPQTYTFNGQSYTATDRRFRQEFIATITVRNRQN